jgi:FeS assembly protein SufD
MGINSELPSGLPHWFVKKQETSHAIFEKIEMPSLRDSPTAGIYTSLKDVPAFESKYPKKHAIIKFFGLTPELEKKGVVFTDFKSALLKVPHLIEEHFMTVVPPKTHKLAALHGSQVEYGVVLYVPKGIKIEQPLIAEISSPYSLSKVFTHTLLIADEDSSVNYFEQYLSEHSTNPSYHSEIGEVIVMANASVNFHTLQDWGSGVLNYSYRDAKLHDGATLNWLVGFFGAKLSVNTVDTHLVGRGSSVGNYGGFFGRGNQHVDISSDAFHIVPNTNNQILWYGVNTNRSTSVFRGMIEIEQVASQTITTMNQYTLLLSKEARSNTIPSLAIKTNDVQAKHGTSVGQINDDHVFYLMTRGLNRDEARRLIVEGFFGPFLVKINDESIRAKIQEKIDSYMVMERDSLI